MPPANGLGITGHAFLPPQEKLLGRFLAKNRPGLHHVCFRVDDLRATVRDLLAKGVVLVNEEPTIGAAGLPIVFVHPKSCGGVLVELQETPAP